MAHCLLVNRREIQVVYLYFPTFYNMKTIIFDIDGTLTNMWPIEKSVLLYMTKGKFEKEIDLMKSFGVSDTYHIFRKCSRQKITKKKYVDFYNFSLQVLLKGNKLPDLESYPLVKWILINRSNYNFVYTTGGQQSETLYTLNNLGLIQFFDLENSISKTTCRFSKRTGIPFKKIKLKFSDCILISDSKSDCYGASLVNIPYILVKPKQDYFDFCLSFNVS